MREGQAKSKRVRQKGVHDDDGLHREQNDSIRLEREREKVMAFLERALLLHHLAMVSIQTSRQKNKRQERHQRLFVSLSLFYKTRKESFSFDR